MYCIPHDAGECPITKVYFKEDPTTNKLVLETSRDPVHGLPIIHLALSQGGNPCFDKDGYNSLIEEKKAVTYSDLSGAQFEKECPTVMNNRKAFTTDPFWTKLSNLPSHLQVNEYTLQE